MVAQVCRRLHHTPGVTRGAHAPALAGEGHKVVVPAIVTASTRKAVGKDAALQILGKRLAHVRLGRMVVALPVKLACTGLHWPDQAMSQGNVV